jgi:uncharacterized RDD family membrane protein YckC
MEKIIDIIYWVFLVSLLLALSLTFFSSIVFITEPNYRLFLPPGIYFFLAIVFYFILKKLEKSKIS